MNQSYYSNFTLEKHLEACGESNRGAQKLLESFHAIREEMHRNLKSVISIFPHYSEHDDEHSENIISALEKLLGENRIRSLPPGDAWAILVCAYMHDVGMIVLDEELLEDWKSEEFQNMISTLLESEDIELRSAARRVSNHKESSKASAQDWPVLIKRDVVLLAAEFYRGKHPQRAVKNMVDSQKVRRLLDITITGGGTIPGRIQNTIAQISVSHGGTFQEMIQRLEPKDSVCGLDFHPRYVAALLRLGDLCDLDNGRFNLMVLDAFGKLTDSNYVHYFKHDSIHTFSISEDGIRIVSNVKFKEIQNVLPDSKSPDEKLELCHRVLLETKNWFTWMDDEIRDIKLYWQDIADRTIDIFSPSLSYQILVDGAETVTSKENMRFSFSNEKAYTLLEGYSLYDDQLIFVRELIQNSLDALKIQFWRDLKAGRMDFLLDDYFERIKNEEMPAGNRYAKLRPFDFSDNSIYEKYKVIVSVEHREGNPTAKFIIEDNGTGISVDDLKNKILKTGSSWHNSQTANEIEEMPGWLKPTGSFGIGLHTVFALTDSIFIETTTELETEMRHIIMHSGKRDGYVFINASGDHTHRYCESPHGTRITINIDMERWDERQYDLKERRRSPLSSCSVSRFSDIIRDKMKAFFLSPLFYIIYKEINPQDFTKTYLTEMPMLYRCEAFKAIFSPQIRDHLYGDCVYQEPGFSYAFWGGGRNIIVWIDTFNSLLGLTTKTPVNIPVNINATCKGIHIQTISTQLDDFCTWPFLSQIDFLGGDSKNIINIARNQITWEMQTQLKDIILKVDQFIARISVRLLTALFQDQEVKNFANKTENIIQCWMGSKEEKLPTVKQIDLCITNMALDHLQYNKAFDKFMVYVMFAKEILHKSKFIDNLINEIEENKNALSISGFSSQQYNNDLTIIFFKAFLKVTFGIVEKKFSYDWFDINCLFNILFGSEVGFRIRKKFTINEIMLFEHNIIGYIGKVISEKIGFTLESDFSRSLMAEALFINHEEEGMFFENRTQFGNEFFDIIEICENILCDYYNKDIAFSNNSVGLYVFLPINNMISTILTFNCKSDEFIDLIKIWIEKQPKNQFGYNFCNATNVSQILKTRNLEINLEYYEYALAKFSHLRYIPCDAITLTEENKLQMSFDTYNLNKRSILIKNQNAFLKYLILFHNSSSLPFFTFSNYDFNNIVIEDNQLKYDLFFGKSNYYIFLWTTIGQIIMEYSLYIKNEQNKQKLIETIMTSINKNGNGVPNLIRYIYHHNPLLNKDSTYDETIRKIESTYREFVSLILDCVAKIIGNDELRKEYEEATEGDEDDADEWNDVGKG